MSTVEETKFSEASSEERSEFIDKFISPVDSSSGNPESSDGDKSVDDDTSADKDEGDATKESSEDSDDLFGEDLREHAAALGLTDEQLAEFTSRDELDRALRLIDANAMHVGRDATKKDASASSDSEKRSDGRPRDEKGRFSKEEEQEPGYTVNLSSDEFPEEVIREFNGLRDYYESKLQAFESRFAALEEAERLREEAAEQREYDSVLDSLGHPELFGETGKESRAERKNRETLWIDIQAYLAGLRAFGKEARLDRSFVSRVLNMTFADHLNSKQRKQLVAKAKSQSDRRSGAAGTKHVEKEYRGPIEEDPELLAEFDRLSGAS